MAAKIVIFAIHKGGEGKTTAAVNIPAYFSVIHGHRVLVIDTDSSSNATITLIDDISRADRSIYDVVVGRCTLRDIVAPSVIPGLDIVPSASNMAGFARAVAAESGADYRLSDMIEESGIAEDYDFIFIDSPPQLELSTTNGLAAAHYMITPMQCTRFSVKGLIDILGETAKIKRRINPKLAFLGGYISRFRELHDIDRGVFEDIKAFYNSNNLNLFKTRIRETVKVKEAALCRKPVFIYDKNCAAAWDYLSLSEEIYCAIKQESPEYEYQSPAPLHEACSN